MSDFANQSEVMHEGRVMQIFEQIRKFSSAGELKAAIDCCRAWLLKNPNEPMAWVLWYEFGCLLHSVGFFSQAENAFQVVLEQNPTYTQASLALGGVLEANGRTEDAMKVWIAALQPLETRIALLNNIGRLANSLWKFEAAEKILAESYCLNSGQSDVLVELIFIRQRLCQWPIILPKWGLGDQTAEFFGPISSLAEFDDTVQNLVSVKKLIDGKRKNKNFINYAKKGELYKKHKRLRLGFLSADFRLHATSVFFGPLLVKLNRDYFEIFALDITLNQDFGSMRTKILSHVDSHIQLQKLTNDEAAKVIHSHEIDVLIDLAGLSGNARPEILMHRPAPIQIAYLGFLGSCGIDEVDFVLSTRDLLLDESACGFIETPLFLPNTYVAIDATSSTISHDELSRSSFGLPDHGFIFCALLNLYKIRPEVFDSWLRILSKTPNSVLWLLEDNKISRANLTEYARNRNIDVSRLIFTARMQPDVYRASLALADIFLDTAPYGNGATAHDAILANLPILTCPGKTMMSRFSAHMMNFLGLSDFVVADRAAYEEFAISLAKDSDRLKFYKEKMLTARQSSLLFDVDSFAHDFGITILRSIELSGKL